MNPLCAKCDAPFLKPTAKFCNRCGAKRVDMPSSVTPTPASSPAAGGNSTLKNLASTAKPTTASASSANTSAAVPAPPPTGGSGNTSATASMSTPTATDLRRMSSTAAVAGGGMNAIATLRDEVLNTLEEEEVDSAKYSNALMTLGPNGITPEMLQTSNAEELKQYKKGLLLGRGTYGSVYLGLLPDGSFHAVKSVELGGKSGAIQPKELVSLSREINLLRRLRHKNLCSFKGVFYSNETTTVHMFMEYIGGGSMTAVVKNFKPLPPDVVRQWTKQLLSGLLYLHTQRIIHRDIKGENLLIDTSADPAKEATVKLVDFGAAKRLTDAVAQSRTIIGTPYWMAPEIVDLSGEGAGYSYKADVWSVGCTVAEMVTGNPPWPARSNVPQAIMMIAQCEGLPTEMPKESDGATLGCIDFMTRCFTRDPNLRPTVEELIEHPWITGSMT